MNEDCLYCHRWEEIKDQIHWADYGLPFPDGFDLVNDCGVSCGRCMPEEEKCYDTDRIRLDGTAGDNDFYTCSDFYNYDHALTGACENSETFKNDFTDAGRDCCACGGGRIGPKCPKEFPYWGIDEGQYLASYMCWKTEDAGFGYHDCENFCIRDRNVNLDKLQLNQLQRCPSSICPDDSNNFDCGKMTATLRSRLEGEVYRRNINGYKDSSNRRCIFKVAVGSKYQMVAIYPERCTISSIGYLDKNNDSDKKCLDSKQTVCWHKLETEDLSVHLSNIRQCKAAIHHCPVAPNNKCGPHFGYCENSLYYNEETELCGDSDTDKNNSSGRYNQKAYKNCLIGEGYTGDLPGQDAISFYKTRNGMYCPPSGDIQTEGGCKSAAEALGLTWGGAYNQNDDWRSCSFTDDHRQKVFFNRAGDAAAAEPNKSNYAGLCKEERCVPFSQEACEAAAGKAGLRLGTDTDPFVIESQTILGCFAYRYKKSGSEIYYNVARYSTRGISEYSPNYNDMYRPHGHDCYQLITYRQQDQYMVAAAEEDVGNGLPYGQIILFAVLAFGVGYGVSKYSTRSSKYLPLVSNKF